MGADGGNQGQILENITVQLKIPCTGGNERY
jgi:hypothetical protein